MTQEELMQGIGLSEEGKKTVEMFEINEREYESWRKLFDTDTERFFQKLDGLRDKEKTALCLYVRFAAKLYPEFVKKGISDKVYFDTFSDFSIWNKCCMEKKGIPGLIEERWLSLPLKMKIFRLGRLQFETDRERGILHVHIPEGAPLSEEACEESFRQADSFFGEEYTMYDCESWLLSPKLSQVLDADSNIIKFQKRFAIQKTRHIFRQAEERVFGEIREDKEQYPERTRLQKKLKAYVLAGNEPGIGYGIIYRKRK